MFHVQNHLSHHSDREKAQEAVWDEPTWGDAEDANKTWYEEHCDENMECDADLWDER